MFLIVLSVDAGSSLEPLGRDKCVLSYFKTAHLSDLQYSYGSFISLIRDMDEWKATAVYIFHLHSHYVSCSHKRLLPYVHIVNASKGIVFRTVCILPKAHCFTCATVKSAICTAKIQFSSSKPNIFTKNVIRCITCKFVFHPNVQGLL